MILVGYEKIYVCDCTYINLYGVYEKSAAVHS